VQHPLDNPIWSALTTDHMSFAVGEAGWKRYPAPVAPFAAVPDEAANRLAPRSLASRDSICFVGALPTFDDAWVVEHRFDLLQMVLPREQRASGGSLIACRELTQLDVAPMVDLTDRVFPGYFRPRTYLMGRYLGIFAESRLVAMAGERMTLEGWCEISAVCTDPGYTGRGYAQALVRLLVDAMFERGVTPFLHVSPENMRARALYRMLGFVERATLPFIRVRSA
jgi:ribosomal protein S18 acetylase RimI-like enzyme